MGEGAPLVDAEKMQVLILGGWSPGPLDWLTQRFDAECVFHEPSLPMPPVGCRWCMSPSVAFLAAWLLGLPGWLFPSVFETIPGVARLLLNVLVFAVAVVCIARDAVKQGVRIASDAIERYNIDVIVGFSWGGGLCCWLLEGGCSLPMLLLAPTQAAMASAAMLRVKRPMFTVDRDRVTIFHASPHDGFCPPSQVAALELTGAGMHMCDDIHAFFARASLEAIGSSFASLIRAARVQRGASGGSCDARG